MQINLINPLNTDYYGFRQETSGPDGTIQIRIIKQTHFGFYACNYHIYKNDELEVSFEQPTFVINLGHPVVINISNATEWQMKEKTAIIISAQKPCKISLRKFQAYHFCFITCEASLLKKRRHNKSLLANLQAKFNPEYGVVVSEQITLADEWLATIEQIWSVKTGAERSTTLMGHITSLLTFVLKAMENEPARIDATDVIESAKDYILANLHLYTTVAVYAKQAGLSLPEHHKLFKEAYGISASDFIENARFEKARKLLDEPIHQIRFIAKTIGFTNERSFVAFFHKHAKQTPKEYRESRKLHPQ